MSEFKLRVKTLSNGQFDHVLTTDSLKTVMVFISESVDVLKAEIVKDGKLFFVFTLDDKAKVFLETIHEMSVESVSVTTTKSKKAKRVKKLSKS